MSIHSDLARPAWFAKGFVAIFRGIAPFALLYQVLVGLYRFKPIRKRIRYFLNFRLQWNKRHILRKIFDMWLLLEGLFYIYCLALQRKFLSRRPAPKLNFQERTELVRNVKNTIGLSQTDPKRFLSLWFQNASIDDIKKGNIEQLIRWGIFGEDGEHQLDHMEKPELQAYVRMIEETCGYKAPEGFNSNVKCMRPSFDKFDFHHRPLIFYMLNHLLLHNLAERYLFSNSGFKRHATKHFHYWIRKGLSSEKPIVFVHGIGYGLVPYLKLIWDLLVYNRTIFLIEIPFISNRICPSVPSKMEIVQSMEDMLDTFKINDAILMGHSFGSVYVSWFIKNRPNRVHATVFIDPVVFLFSTADTSFNFLYKRPESNCAASQLTHYFFRKDLFLAHYLFRHFWWYECAVWKQDIQQKTLVILSENDNIIPVSLISDYLSSENPKVSSPRHHILKLKTQNSKLSVDILPDAGHGELLLSSDQRKRFLQLLEEEIFNSV